MSKDDSNAAVRGSEFIAELGAGSEAPCRCVVCTRSRGDTVHGLPREMTEMIVCPVCGDKRCVHAKDHTAPCAKSDIYAHNAWIERHLLFARLEAPNARLTGTQQHEVNDE